MRCENFLKLPCPSSARVATVWARALVDELQTKTRPRGHVPVGRQRRGARGTVVLSATSTPAFPYGDAKQRVCVVSYRN